MRISSQRFTLHAMACVAAVGLSSCRQNRFAGTPPNSNTSSSKGANLSDTGRSPGEIDANRLQQGLSPQTGAAGTPLGETVASADRTGQSNSSDPNAPGNGVFKDGTPNPNSSSVSGNNGSSGTPGASNSAGPNGNTGPNSGVPGSGSNPVGSPVGGGSNPVLGQSDPTKGGNASNPNLPGISVPSGSPGTNPSSPSKGLAGSPNPELPPADTQTPGSSNPGTPGKPGGTTPGGTTPGGTTPGGTTPGGTTPGGTIPPSQPLGELPPSSNDPRLTSGSGTGATSSSSNAGSGAGVDPRNPSSGSGQGSIASGGNAGKGLGSNDLNTGSGSGTSGGNGPIFHPAGPPLEELPPPAFKVIVGTGSGSSSGSGLSAGNVTSGGISGSVSGRVTSGFGYPVAEGEPGGEFPPPLGGNPSSGGGSGNPSGGGGINPNPGGGGNTSGGGGGFTPSGTRTTGSGSGTNSGSGSWGNGVPGGGTLASGTGQGSSSGMGWSPTVNPEPLPPGKVPLLLKLVKYNYEAWWKDCLSVAMLATDGTQTTKKIPVGCNKTIPVGHTIVLPAEPYPVCNRIRFWMDTHKEIPGSCRRGAICLGPWSAQPDWTRVTSRAEDRVFFKVYDARNLTDDNGRLLLSSAIKNLPLDVETLLFPLKKDSDAFRQQGNGRNRTMMVFTEDQPLSNLNSPAKTGIDYNDFIFAVRGEGVAFTIEGSGIECSSQ